jgi:type IV pilus assembly protein PilV
MFIHHRERGFGLVEILVALVVIAIGMLGVAGLQLRSNQAELESYQRAQALILLQDMVDRLNTNRDARACYASVIAAMNPAYLGTSAGAIPACAGAGTTATRARADADLVAWDSTLKGATETRGGTNVGTMTGARGCVRVDAAGLIYTVTVAWQGEVPTLAPAAADTCAQNTYGDEALRRLVSATVEFADLD